MVLGLFYNLIINMTNIKIFVIIKSDAGVVLWCNINQLNCSFFHSILNLALPIGEHAVYFFIKKTQRFGTIRIYIVKCYFFMASCVTL